MLLPVNPTRFRKRPPRIKVNKAAPPAALTLVSARFFDDEPGVELKFDRAIDISSVDPTAIEVDDDVFTGNWYAGAPGSASLTAPDTVEFHLDSIQVGQGGGVFLYATAMSGIVAVDDGGTWAGVTALALPFP